jgi:hypothetical protein
MGSYTSARSVKLVVLFQRLRNNTIGHQVHSETVDP